MSSKSTILFLCTGNSCRSQLAEAWTRHLHGGRYAPYSAGIEPRELDPRAIRVMAEVGIDISQQQPKHVDTLGTIEFDYVVTVCDHVHEACPFFPARKKLLHQGFPDPPALARGARDEEEALEHYRKVRDQVKAFADALPEILGDREGSR